MTMFARHLAIAAALALPLAQPALVGCGEDGTVRHLVLQVDSSACKASCTISRYAIWVHRLDGAGRCALYERSKVTGLGAELFEPAAIPAGSELVAGAAAICDGTAPTPTTCCQTLGSCLQQKPVAKSTACDKAAATCPTDGNPYGASAVDYYNKTCTGSGSGSSCVVCRTESQLKTAGDDLRSLSLVGVSDCKTSIPIATVCP